MKYIKQRRLPWIPDLLMLAVKVQMIVRGYIKAPILGVKLINTWLFQLNALGAFSLTNLVFSSIT